MTSNRERDKPRKVTIKNKTWKEMRKTNKPSLNVDNEDSDSFEDIPESEDSDHDESNEIVYEEKNKVIEKEVVLGYIGNKLYPEDDVDKYVTKIGGQPVKFFHLVYLVTGLAV